MKSHWLVKGLLCVLALTTFTVWGMGGQWVDAKVIGFENSNVRVQSQYWEFIVNTKKVNPSAVKEFRLAGKNKPVTFLLPQDAVVSKKKIKNKKSSTKKGGKK